MSGLAGMIHWDGKPVEAAHMDLMMRMIQHRGPDGLRWEANSNVTLGHAMLALKKGEERQQQPVWLPDQSCGIVADARIYNRDELLHRLGDISWFDDAPSDAALLLAAYERWGVDCLDLLDGDFAFAIWDGDKNHIFAARDPYGVKPFFFRWENQRFLFGSEPKQMLVLPDVPVEPDDLIVGEYLLRKYKEQGRTFFNGIQRLPPLHYLIATPQGVVQSRWWNPDPEKEVHHSDPQDYYDQFRELLKASIAKRLGTDFPVGAHLSGGFDSPSIVVLAAEIYRQEGDRLPPLETISAVYGDLPCDETSYINAVTRLVPFRGHTFSPPDKPVLLEHMVEELWMYDTPFGNYLPGFTDGSSQALSRMGARILLDGVGGDEVASQYDYLHDLAIQKMYLTLLRESWMANKYSNKSFIGLLFSAFSVTVPETLRRLYRQIIKQDNQTQSKWINEKFIELLDHYPPSTTPPTPQFKSLTQALIYNDLNHPVSHWNLEALDALGAYNGYEPRHPYCDRNLVEFVLSIPLEHRINGGDWRSLQRRGLALCLPQEILTRKEVTHFNSYISSTLYKIKPELEDLLFSSEEWCSERYINRGEASSLFKNNFVEESKADKTKLALSVWGIFYLEMWLRGFWRYRMVELW